MRPIRVIANWTARQIVHLTRIARPAPIANGAMLEAFLASRAANVSQTALYGYLKTRMGTRYRAYFEDETFAAAIRAARTQVFAACLADLTVYAVAQANDGGGPDRYARARFSGALGAALAAADEGVETAPHLGAFDARLREIDWSGERTNPAPFAQGAAALVDHAPVVDAFKDLDREIVENSVIFRMAEVQTQLAQRLDRPAIAAEIAAMPSGL